MAQASKRLHIKFQIYNMSCSFRKNVRNGEPCQAHGDIKPSLISAHGSRPSRFVLPSCTWRARSMHPIRCIQSQAQFRLRNNSTHSLTKINPFQSRNVHLDLSISRALHASPLKKTKDVSRRANQDHQSRHSTGRRRQPSIQLKSEIGERDSRTDRLSVKIDTPRFKAPK